ncbi:unnamed protein product [Mycena citricolor]|uniref:Uncharacterized protein n=1 Tax=Mycena citricolor TaxID=2018698 RepID=A0AAD2HRJ0_9AGAR|nr:unnamed protein product [Mycena citricolor]
MAPREPLRLNVNIPPPLNNPALAYGGQPMFSPALPTALHNGFLPQFPLRTPMQPFFNVPVPGAPPRPTHRQGAASMANFTPSALQGTFPMTPGGGHFPRPSLGPGQLNLGGGPPFPGRNRRQPSIGGPPKAVLGGPAAARKLSPLPPVVDTPPPAPAKAKKVIVKLPHEAPKDDAGAALEPPVWARRPLDAPFVFEDVVVAEAELTSGEMFPPEDHRGEMPPTLEVFLPGKRAWQDIKKREIDEKLERLGVESSPSIHSSHGPHTRAASISSPADPALLLFKLNKLQQAQTKSSLNPSPLNSLSTSPQPPMGLSPSPGFQPAPRFLNRHGYSMSLAQPPTFSPASNPFGPNAFLPRDQTSTASESGAESDTGLIHAPQGRIPLSIPPFTSKSAQSSRPVSRDSRPDFIRGFGLDVTEEEDETEEESEGNDLFATISNVGVEERRVEVENEFQDEEDEEAMRTVGHSRHVSKLSGALSLRTVGGIVGDVLNNGLQRTELVLGDASEDMDLELEVSAEWTGSEDHYRGGDISDEESIGDWSNPSDEERARQQRVDRRMQRRLDDEPRRVPNFPRPPENTAVFRRDYDDLISNPSEEEAMDRTEYLAVDANKYYTAASPASRPLPALPHSRGTSGNFTIHDPAQAHSRLPSGNSMYVQPESQPVMPRRDSLNPHAKPFVFGAPISLHSRLPSSGTGLNPGAIEFKPRGLNIAAAEFKPTGFTFRPPAGVPHVAFPEPETVLTVDGSPFKTQGREKRQRLSTGSEADDTMSSFRFPPTPRRPEEPTAFSFGGFAASNSLELPTVMPVPMSPTVDDASQSFETEVVDMPQPEPEPEPATMSSRKRPPVPLDFTAHGSSPSVQLDFRSGNTVPAGLFKAMAANGDERTRRTVRSRLSSHEFHSHRPSLDDQNVASITRKISRSRLVTDPGLSMSPVEDVFASAARTHSRRRSSLPDALRDATDPSVSDEQSVAADLTTRMELHRYEERLEALLDDKLEGFRRQILQNRTSLSPSAEAMITEVVQLFRSQLQDSAARGLEDSQLDARGELDFEMIKDLVQQGHAEARSMLKHELAALSLRGVAPGDSVGPLMQELNQRTVHAVVDAIQDLSLRLETINGAAPARERDSMVEGVVSALVPVLNGLRPEMVDYDHLTEKLTQAVKPHISQLIDLASDKRETAGLIVDRILPLLPSQSQNVDTDAIALRLTSEIRHAIKPIDAFEIKEQVADLVVERLDSRLAVRDRSLNPETMAGKLSESIVPLLEPLSAHLTTLVDGQRQLSAQQSDLAAAVELVNSLPPRLLESVKSASGSDKHLQQLKSAVNNVASEQKAMSSTSQQLLALNKDLLEHLTALPDSLAAATNILQGAHAEFALTRDANKREMDELRRSNTDFQVQTTKARGLHGQVRVEKDVLVEKLSIVEADRDRLRTQLKDAQTLTSAKASEMATVEARNKELEQALSKALARLQVSDATHQTSQDKIAELEKTSREAQAERQALKSKVDSLDLQAAFAARDKESAQQALATLQKQHDNLTSQQTHWDDLRHASAQIEMLTSLIGQADNEELKELRQVRERSKAIEAEHAALLKRFKDQEAKLVNSEKSAVSARQSLSTAQLRSAEWEKRAKDYEGQLELTQTKLDQTEQMHSRLEADHSLARLQLEEREADERLAQDRDNKLRDQIIALETKVAQLEQDRARAKTPTKSAAAPRASLNGLTNGVARPSSRASTVYPSRPNTPTLSENTSVWDSRHAPARGTNGSMHAASGNHGVRTTSIHAPVANTPTPASRYSGLANQPRRPTSQAYRYSTPVRQNAPSPTPSVVSLAPTQGADGWWS